eukprot:1616002-Rhodomonas_salina.2
MEWHHFGHFFAALPRPRQLNLDRADLWTMHTLSEAARRIFLAHVRLSTKISFSSAQHVFFSSFMFRRWRVSTRRGFARLRTRQKLRAPCTCNGELCNRLACTM